MSNADVPSVSQYPKFAALLAKLSTHLNDDGSSKAMQARYDVSKSVLGRERKSFLKEKIVQNICEEYSAGPDEDRTIVREHMAACKVEKMITINHSGKKVALGNITSKDLEKFKNPERAQEVLKPVIEDEVVRYKETLDKFCGASANRSVQSIIQNNDYTRSKVKTTTDELQLKQLQYIRKAGEALRLFDKATKRRTTSVEKESHLERATSLLTTSTKLHLLASNVEAKVFAQTYIQENVAALKVIHTHLTERQKELEKERSHSSHMLDAYCKLGDEFTALVDMYSELNTTLETYKFALSI